MKRTRIFGLGIGIILAFSLTLVGQQNGAAQGSTNAQGSTHRHEIPSADEHLKMLSQKLDLTADQQTKIRPIMQQMHDSMQKLMQAHNLSQDEMREKHKEIVGTADKQIREYLNDDQKRKLDELEEESHLK